MITRGFSLAVALLIAGANALPALSLAPAAEPAGSNRAAAETEESEETFSPVATGTVKEENVNVRGRASFVGEVLTKLQKGDKVTILEEITLKKPAKGEPTNWFRISLPEKVNVWVFTDFIDAKTVKASRLNYRGGPGENYSILGRLVKGDAVETLSTKGYWTEIQAPKDAYAFVAADLIEKQSAAPAAPEPTPAPAPAPVPEPAPAPEVVAAPEEPAIAAPEPAAPITQPAAPITEPAPPIVAAPEPEPVEEVLVKRIVKREGIVRKSRNIQSPTYFELESVDSGKLINYLHSPETLEEIPDSDKKRSVPVFDLEPYVGRRVIVTGEEFMDKRWKSTPVIEIEAIDLQQ